LTTAHDGKHGPEKIGSILDSVLEASGLNRRVQERDLLEAWPGVVGERIAAHSRAVDLQDGVLQVDADHAAWRQELTLLFPEILRRFQARFGEHAVKEIRWLRGRGRGYGR